LVYGEKRYKDGKEIIIPPEIATTGVEDRLGIDYETRIVTPEHRKKEQEDPYLMKHIGSVGSGTSGCRIDTILRIKKLPKAKDFEELKPYLTDTKKEIYGVLEKGGNILLEGDHGAKLDSVHGEYPFVTTRIVNEAAFLAEAGIPSREVRDVYLVLKPYTTRVGPGPLNDEIFDERMLNWAHGKGGEIGTVSQRLRRIGKFEWENVKSVIKMNGATKLVFTHLDCPSYVWEVLGFDSVGSFFERVEKELCQCWPYPKISLCSFGPEEKDVVFYTGKEN